MEKISASGGNGKHRNVQCRVPSVILVEPWGLWGFIFKVKELRPIKFLFMADLRVHVFPALKIKPYFMVWVPLMESLSHVLMKEIFCSCTNHPLLGSFDFYCFWTHLLLFINLWHNISASMENCLHLVTPQQHVNARAATDVAVFAKVVIPY